MDWLQCPYKCIDDARILFETLDQLVAVGMVGFLDRLQ